MARPTIVSRPGVSGLSNDLITGMAVFTKEENDIIKECANRSNGSSNHSLRSAMKSICLDFVMIHTVLDADEITQLKELSDSNSLCEAMAIICKKALSEKP